MAQAGYTPISLYYSTTAAAVPTAGNLVAGELAINITDGKLYYENNSGVVTLLAGAGGAGIVAGSNTQLQFNNSGVFGASASLTWNGTTLSSTQVNITGQGTLRLEDTTGGEYVGLRSPSALGASYTLTFPADDGTSGQALITDGSGVLSWSTAASGDVYGPASSTDNAVARFDSTTGKLLQNSVVLIGDTGAVTGITDLTTTGNTILGDASTDTLNVGNGGLVKDASGNVGIGTASPVSILNASFSGGAVSGTHSMAFGIPYAANLQLKSTNAGTSVAVASVGLYGNPERTREFAFYNQATDARVGYLGYQYGSGGVITDLGLFNALAGALTFSTNNAEVGRFTSAGFFGVGTNSPLSPIDVSGSISAPSFSAGAIANLSNTNSASTADTRLVFRTAQTPDGLRERAIIVGSLESTSGGYLSFWTRPNGDGISEKVRITAAGNVGIGTTSPKLKLEVVGTDAAESGTATPNGAIIVGNPTASNSQNLTMGTVNGAGNHAWIQSRNSTQALFYSLALNPSGGNVGIGTSSPTAKLEVVGKTIVGSTSADALEVFSNGDTEIGFSYSTKGNIYAKIIGDITNASPLAGDIAFQTATGGTLAERMRITSAGNVGIGTTAPNAKLTVWTPSTTGLQTALRLNNPFGFGDLNTGAQIVFSQDRTTAEDLQQGIIAVGQASPGTSAVSYMAFYTNNTGVTEKMRLDNAGNLLVAATAVGNGGKLYVNGSISLGTTTGGTQSSMAKDTTQLTASISTSATTIYTDISSGMSSASAGYFIIYGSNNAGAGFMDVVIAKASGTPVVVSSSTIEGSPAARTYSVSSFALRLTMASGTYNVNLKATVLGYPF